MHGQHAADAAGCHPEEVSLPGPVLGTSGHFCDGHHQNPKHIVLQALQPSSGPQPLVTKLCAKGLCLGLASHADGGHY
jgi:hypothetical protein